MEKKPTGTIENESRQSQVEWSGIITNWEAAQWRASRQSNWLLVPGHSATINYLDVVWEPTGEAL
jgi:hypothetical protein